jgi:hypothetical protein
MFDHGLFGSADPPAKTHPWASLTDLKPGTDPREAPNNFLKDDGETLMTFEEMMKSGQRPYDAYKRWLRRPDDNPWVDLGVQQSIDSAFINGFPDF